MSTSENEKKSKITSSTTSNLKDLAKQFDAFIKLQKSHQLEPESPISAIEENTLLKPSIAAIREDINKLNRLRREKSFISTSTTTLSSDTSLPKVAEAKSQASITDKGFDLYYRLATEIYNNIGQIGEVAHTEADMMEIISLQSDFAKIILRDEPLWLKKTAEHFLTEEGFAQFTSMVDYLKQAPSPPSPTPVADLKSTNRSLPSKRGLSMGYFTPSPTSPVAPASIASAVATTNTPSTTTDPTAASEFVVAAPK